MNRKHRALRTIHLHAAFKLARQVVHESQPEGVGLPDLYVAGYADSVILDHQEPAILCKSLMHQRHGLNAPLALLEQAADSFVRNRISLEA